MISESDRKALIVVDTQVDFCEGGKLAVTGGNQVAGDIAEYIQNNQDDYDLIIATQDWHIDPGLHFSQNPDYVDTWPEHCVADSPGAALHPALIQFKFDSYVHKGEFSAAYSGFEGGDAKGLSLEEILLKNNISVCDVCGIATDYCVAATALDARKKGFYVELIEDLCVGVNEEKSREFINSFKNTAIEL